jgi:hypothetical protein
MKLHAPQLGTKLIIPPEILHGHIVGVDMVASRDWAVGESDDLSVLPHGLARGNVCQSDFVPGWDIARSGQARGRASDFGSLFDRTLQNGNVIRPIKNQQKVFKFFSHKAAIRLNVALAAPKNPGNACVENSLSRY